MRTLILTACLALAACGDNLGPQAIPEACGFGLEPYTGDPESFRTFSVWVQDDPDLDVVAAAEACDVWLPEGLQCWPIPIPQANVRIRASHDACTPDAEGGYVLATAYGGGDIVVQIECMRMWFETDDDGYVSRQALKLVLAHEIGHQTGMWWHVPSSCDADAAHGDFEKSLVAMGICGKAVMNPEIDLNTCFMTDLDAEAYALRDRASSSIPSFAATDTPDGCVLSVRPAP